MRRAGHFALLFCLASGLAFAEGNEGESSLQMWKWANFVVLAGALGYLMAKTLPPLFASRAQTITRDIAESQKIRQEAEDRAAEVDRRLATIAAEITALRAESKVQTDAEAERLAQHTAAEIARVQAQSAREIGDAGRNAQTELRRFTAGLAIDSAVRKIRAGMTPATEDRLVRGFMRNLR